MKRAIIFLFVVLTGYTVKAQPAAGNLFVGGSVGISTSNAKLKSGSTTQEEYTRTSFTLMPMAGYFLSEKLAVGAQLGIEGSVIKMPDNDPDKRSESRFVIEPFGRYYLISGTGGIFAEASLGFGIGKAKAYYDAVTTETNLFSFSAGVAPGAYYYITPKLAIEGKFGWFGFASETEKDGDVKETNNSFNFSAYPSSLSFGIILTL